ncbi:hypothetical protein [Priestia koreensis]|uniref:Uncharacterized protein n=1 Tax=Priestia koreensis TaxID=284581 RepID=A0A0M0KXI7_9BACI|nr:hypothetical protein [Priestia koreensis]KOO43524.1 hypothetical protein AMD01_16060 [Priestia koreensis]UNL83049.1 hypothetical protein IE339_12665 [Priestia koreensis]
MNHYQHTGYTTEYLHYYVPYSYAQPFPSYDTRFQNQNVGGLKQRVAELERQNVQQIREITRLNQVVERHTFRLNRLNQRLRVLEKRFNIPFTAEDGF